MKINVMQPPLMGARIGNRPLSIGEFVPAAALMARHLSVEALEDPTGLQELYRKQQVMTKTLRQALPIETELKNSLTYHLRKVDLEIARHEHTPEFELPTLDPSFLSWKTKAGFPAFSIFPLDSDTMTVSLRRPRRGIFVSSNLAGGLTQTVMPEELQAMLTGRPPENARLAVSPTIPDIMAKHYLDDNLFQGLDALCDEAGVQGIELTAKYGGVMPDHVREHIHKWLNVAPGQPCFEKILIVAEAPEESWKVKEIPREDPLVIGVAHGLLWLIDVYDLTTIERFARNLCTDAPKVRN